MRDDSCIDEVWRPVVGFEGLYEVSDLGRVKSYQRGNVRILRPGLKPSGHLNVVLGRGNNWDIHVLVLAAFVGPKPAGYEVRHIDGDPANNIIANLMYATRGRNSQDKKWHNGQKNYILSPADVLEIKRRLNKNESCSKLATMFGVATVTIYAIKHGRFHKDIQP